MTNEQKPERGPCLHCGCKYSSVISNSTKYHIDCNRCHATGEEKWTEAEAIAAWNRRHLCPDHEFVCNTCDHKCEIALALQGEKK